MKRIADVEALILARRAELDREPFLQHLDRSASVDDVRRFVPHLYFYVYAFQDVLRLTADLTRDPELAVVTRHHRAEDAGHELWFAYDAIALGCERELSWVFGPEHRATRDVAYRLVTEVIRADDDRVRLVVPLVLEAAGSLFFYRVIGALERSGFDRPLRYFARQHQQVEADHEIFKDQTAASIGGIGLDAQAFARAIASVDRCFDVLRDFARLLHQHLAGAQPG